MRVRSALILACVFAIHSTTAFTADPAPIRAAVQKELDAGLFPGAVVCLGNHDGIVYLEVFGDAQVTPARVAMRTDSIFDMASVTKAVATATAIGILIDDGKLTFDETLAVALPDQQSRSREQITLRHLGAHVGGFRDAPRTSSFGTGEQFFPAVLKLQPVDAPGDKFQYSCKNCILLSTIVERASGQRFEDFCEARIFLPLAMRDTRFHRVPASDRVVGWYGELGLDHNEDGQAAGRGIGNAGLFSTANDLARFCRMMLARGALGESRILSEQTHADLLKRWHPTSPHAFLWQIGTELAHRPKGLSQSAYGHSGWTGQSLWIDPDRDQFLLVLTNRVHPKREETSTPRGREQVHARARIGTVVLEAFPR